MEPLIQIKSNVPDDVLRIELFLSNVCNYKCWYCTPDYYGNTEPWPAFDKIVRNFDHLLSHYREHFGKRHFNLYIGGGEPSTWPDLVPFLEYFRAKHGCKINISTNGSRSLRWWKDNAEHFDHVRISVHSERADAAHVADVADCLYENNVSVIASVLMDPFNWDQCVDNIETLKHSKHKWLITASETIHSKIAYTPAQRDFVKQRVYRHSGLWYQLKTLRYKKPKYHKPTVYFANGTNRTVDTHEIILNKWNKFKGWDCNVGIDTFFINKDGDIQGACGEPLYGLDYKFNLYSEDFIDTFSPSSTTVSCSKDLCTCQDEANVSKVIPIISI
jgi:MoaA/NifB/PqqE/SkfB family radical SAM enzyme